MQGMLLIQKEEKASQRNNVAAKTEGKSNKRKPWKKPPKELKHLWGWILEGKGGKTKLQSGESSSSSPKEEVIWEQWKIKQ